MDEKQEHLPPKNPTNTEDYEDYIRQLTPFEQSVHRIAKSHLGSSFNLKKSNGYMKWIGKK
jgi:hypothetical protein